VQLSERKGFQSWARGPRYVARSAGELHERPGVIARPLGMCGVQYHAEWHATVLACPGTDLIKVWPLPIEQPWYEDPFADKHTI
jgi:hypothetical protein